MLSILKIEIDGHFHGGEPVKPWVAQITGIDSRYGLARQFLKPMNDWSNASAAWSGKVYGRVAHFALRDGYLYEVSRCRGRPSKRYVAREFLVVDGRKRVALDPVEALARMDGAGDRVAIATLDDATDGSTRVSRVHGLGAADLLGWVVVDGQRLYRLAAGGLYEIVTAGARRLEWIADDLSRVRVSEEDAWRRLHTANSQSA